MNKYEQLIEHIINDDEAKARALFHDIVVEKSRDIYESLMDEEYAEEGRVDEPVDSMIDEISMDETNGIGEGDDDPMNMDDMDMGDMGDDDMSNMDMDRKDDNEMYEAQHDDEDKEEDEEDDKEEKMEESVYESRQRRPLQKTAVDLMREYVEKISAPSNTEGQPAGTSAGGDHASVNTQSTVAGKNDMGGTAKNLAQGASESAPDGTSAPKKGTTKDLPHAGKFENVPGAKAGKTFSNKEKAKTGEEGGINKHSIEPGGN